MKKYLYILLLILATGHEAHADYMIGDMKSSLNSITAILDVKVTSFTKEGFANIEILESIKSPKVKISVIKNTALSCTGGTPKQWGMKPETRYIVFLVKDNLFEESSFFEVTEIDGAPKCKLGWYKKWFQTKEEWLPITTLKLAIQSANKS